MKKVSFFFFLLPLALISTACGGRFVSNTLLGELDYGMSSSETMNVFNNEPDERIDLTLDDFDSEYEVHFYERPVYFNNYLYTRRYYDYVVLCFRDGQLFCWGPVDDFKTHSDEEIVQLGNMVADYMYEEL